MSRLVILAASDFEISLSCAYKTQVRTVRLDCRENGDELSVEFHS